jgi:ankyrin repeat protein
MPLKKGSVEIVKLLLMQEHVDINLRNKYGQTPLQYAVGQKCVEISKLLLAREDVDVNSKDKRGHTPLHAITRRSFSDLGDETIELLLSHPRVKVNIRGKLGRTALSEAAAKGDIEWVELLLSHGAAVDKRDYFGLTPRLRAQYRSWRGSTSVTQ